MPGERLAVTMGDLPIKGRPRRAAPTAPSRFEPYISSYLAETNSRLRPTLFISQRGHRVHLCRSSRRDVTRGGRNETERQGTRAYVTGSVALMP
jgi:uncharacterized protein YfaQ (DUF2300 family)